MATTFKFGSRRLKTLLATVATTATLSTVSTMTPAVAQEAAPVDIQSLLSSDNASIADLAGAIASIEEQVAKIEAELGLRREDVNRALVDLQDARTEAEQARRGTTTARGELDTAQSDVEQAQAKLNELSRTAYRRANTSDAVSTAAGNDARGDMLERQSYLRTQTKDQQAILDQLERERTEKANKESQLRKTQQLAEQREERATEAEAAARQTLEDSTSRVEEFSSQRESLMQQHDKVQKALNQAKGLDSSEQPGSKGEDNVKPNNLTESSVNQSSGEQSTDSQTAPQTSVATSQAATPQSAQSATESAIESANESAAQPGTQSATESATTTASQEQTTAGASDDNGGFTSEESVERQFHAEKSGNQLSASDVRKAAEAAKELSSDPNVQKLSSDGVSMQGSSLDSGSLGLAATAIGAAAAIVGAAQPNHTGLTQEELDAFAQGSSQLAALQGSGDTNTDDDSLTGEVSDVLGGLKTTDDVTEEATDVLGNADRNAKIEAVIARAQSQIGVPYAWGGGDANGPTKGIRDGGVADSYGDYNKVGFDCSGLTLYAFAGAGISLPHYTGYQYQKGTQVPASQMQRGDLIFYGPGGSQHVAIYLGDGTMIEAPQSGSNVQVSPVRQSGMAPNVVRLL